MRHLQRLLLISLLYLIGSINFAHAGFNCEYLVGSWSNEIYDKTRKLQRSMIETVHEDGSYWIKFIFPRGDNKVSERELHGTWSCSGEDMTIAYDNGNVAIYKILELSEMSYKLRSINGIVYEYFKVRY